MLLLAIATFAATVDSIRIESRWGGFGMPSDVVYKIARHGDRYVRRRQPVSPEAVERLVSAIEAASLDRQAGLRAIATPEWLDAVVHQPHPNAYGVPVCSDEAKRRFAQRAADPDFAASMLGRYFSQSHTDDYPAVIVDVVLHDGRKLHVESQAQQALMLPWRAGGVETWNPELPRAIAALLPKGVESRLTDEHLQSDYAGEAARELEQQLDELEARCVHRDIVAAVEGVFEHVYVDSGSTGDFVAFMRRSDFPPNLVLRLVITGSEKPGALTKLDRTVQRLPGYLDVVRSFVAAHPEKSFAIWCVDGRSVENNDRAVRLMEWHLASGSIDHARVILPDGEVREEQP
jgi:hypothetical protein